MTPLLANHTSPLPSLRFTSVTSTTRTVLDETAFKGTIAIERKRTERTNKPFLLMLLGTGHHQELKNEEETFGKVASALLSTTRDTDVVGWYSGRSTIGVLHTGLEVSDRNAVLSSILNRVSSMLRDELTGEQLNQMSIAFHFFPDDWDGDGSGGAGDPALYPDLLNPTDGKRLKLAMKRATDILGSLFLLLLFSPLSIAIALAIKATSKGPILFRQERVGERGRRFVLLKFRTMYAGNDPNLHKEFTRRFIANDVESRYLEKNGNGVYKLTNDQRITTIGRLLRKTSLDELPQFLNVLRGEMSLVGPRPALPYEFEIYQTWHRRRVLDVKPGITGLWQVTSRSQVRFDEMVRLDLRYVISWTSWLDLKILMRTPFVMVRGHGAY